MPNGTPHDRDDATLKEQAEMLTLLMTQLDYIYFFHGLSFILLAITCLTVVRTGKSRLPWGWLGASGFAHGIVEWLELPAAYFPDSPLFSLPIIIIRIASYACLALFGCCLLRYAGHANLARWILAVLPGLVILPSLFGKPPFMLISRYILGFLGSMLAAVMLYRATGSLPPRARKPLTLASMVFGAHGVTTLFGPESPLSSPSLFGQSSLLIATGVRIQLVRGIIASIGAIAVWWYYLSLRKDSDEQSLQYQTRFGLHIALNVSAIIVAGWILTQIVGGSADRSFRREFLVHSRMAASLLEPAGIAQLKGLHTDSKTHTFDVIRSKLKAIRLSDPDCRFVYLLGLRRDQVIILADSEPIESNDYAHPGHPYPDAAKELVSVFRSPRSFVQGPITDQWGSWLSAIVPICEPGTGKVLAILGMDIPSSIWAMHVAKYRLAIICMTLLLSLLTLTYAVMMQNTQEFSARISSSERHYRSLVEGSPNGIALLDQRGHLLSINDAGLSAMGWTEAEIIGQSLRDIWPEHERTKLHSAFAQATTGVMTSIETTYTGANNKSAIFGITFNPIPEQNGRIHRIVAICTDITERRAAEEALRRSEAKYREFIEMAQEGIWAIDTNAKITFVNPRMAGILGYAPNEMLGHPLFNFLDESHAVSAGSDAHWCEHEIQKATELEFLRKDGTRVYTSLATSPILDEAGNFAGVFAFVSDITEKKAYQEHLAYQAYHDHLTGLPNRLLFGDLLRQRMSSARRKERMLAVMFLDLDNFKQVNDTMGHGQGDALLKMATQRLLECLRESDTLARVGGDEFIVLLDEITDPDEARKVAERILRVFTQPFVLDCYSFRVSTSIGISLFPEHGANAEQLVRNADTAMYSAKEKGRNRYGFYTEELESLASRRQNRDTGMA